MDTLAAAAAAAAVCDEEESDGDTTEMLESTRRRLKFVKKKLRLREQRFKDMENAKQWSDHRGSCLASIIKKMAAQGSLASHHLPVVLTGGESDALKRYNIFQPSPDT